MKSKVRETERDREKKKEDQKKKKRGKKKIILNSKIEYRKLKVKTSKNCFLKTSFKYRLHSIYIRVQDKKMLTKQTNICGACDFFDFKYKKLDLNPVTKYTLMKPDRMTADTNSSP